MRFRLTMAMTLLLFGAVDIYSETMRGFSFKAHIFNPLKHSESSVLRKGHILQPVDPSGREALYQPVVLCRDVKVEFDEHGLSKEVEIFGFCYGPGMPIPLSRVEWWIPGLVNTAVRDHGCELRNVVRQHQRTPNPAMTEDKPMQSYRGSQIECINRFDAWLKINCNLSYLDAQGRGLCNSPVAAPNQIEKIYEFYCNRAALTKLGCIRR